MDIEYKSDNKEKPIFIYTHFLHRKRTTSHKIKIANYNRTEIDNQIVQDSINEMNADQNNIHSINVLCDFIEKNPIKTFEKFTEHDIISFFSCIKLLEIQKEVLQSICYLIQLLPFHDEFQQIILRNNFYSDIQKLIEPPIENECHELALWCTVYSLKLNGTFRACLFEKNIFKTLMKYSENDINMSTDYSEYIRGKFFKTATFYCDEMGEMLLDDIIRFLVNSILNISPPNQTNRLFLSGGIDALRNTFKSTNFGLELIEANNMIPIFVSLLFDKDDKKIRISSAKMIYELIQSMVFSSMQVVSLGLMKKLFKTSKLNDILLFRICMTIMKEILNNPESFMLPEIIDSLDEFSLSNCFVDCCNFEIKIEMLSVLQLLIFYANDEQVSKILSPNNIEFLSDLINAGNCGVSADVLHVFSIAMSIQEDSDFPQIIKNIIIDTGAYEQLQAQINDPDNNKDDIAHIEAFLRSPEFSED